MPALLIQIIDNQWVAEVANTNIRYNFLGANLGSQTQHVQYLAGNMAYNGEDMAEFNRLLPNALDLDGVAADVVTQQLYAGTDMINYAGRIVYSAVGDEMLIDDLVEAGEALCIALGMFPAALARPSSGARATG
ncbi:hypothetical protein [Nannocystis bainbridge]|uniref:Uncharacterized protein n=1 Tax=Nannocystis bainbridge TaxID=2995303 RepID=A0ABT5DZI3_9BACT|nr:hypothetical protein [Nannocystis bainbridge]MDC0719039.1 hypothetical protein [Nannocystis bainbridge]